MKVLKVVKKVKKADAQIESLVTMARKTHDVAKKLLAEMKKQREMFKSSMSDFDEDDLLDLQYYVLRAIGQIGDLDEEVRTYYREIERAARMAKN